MIAHWVNRDSQAKTLMPVDSRTSGRLRGTTAVVGELLKGILVLRYFSGCSL
jgi:hypothetical protein